MLFLPRTEAGAIGISFHHLVPGHRFVTHPLFRTIV